MSNTETATAGSQAPPAISGGAAPGRTAKKKSRQDEGSSAVPLYGKRRMKQYPITQNELSQLGQLRNSATIFSSVGTAGIGIGLGLLKDLVITDKPKSVLLPMITHFEVPNYGSELDWKPISLALIIFGILSFLFGMYQIFVGKSLVKNIERETSFNEQN